MTNDWNLWLCLLVVSVGLWLVSRGRQRRTLPGGMTRRGFKVGTLAFQALVRRGVYGLRKAGASRERRRELSQQCTLKTAQEAAEVMGQMKGVFMKLGQIVSFADDALGSDAQAALRTLQQDAPPMSFELVRGVVESELGATLESLFDHFEATPLAAASIGQVHRARLKDGTEVVLKVQYPGVAEAIESDLKFAGGIVAMVNAIYPNADGKAVVRELKERVKEELNYELELENQALFAALWREHPLICIPEVYRAFSTRRVLCQEYVDGLSFYNFLEVATAAEKELAVFVLNDFVFDSMHRHHLFNGDPHPGNYLFHSDGRVTFLDFGCVKFFEGTFIRDLQQMNRAIVEEDRAGFEASVRTLGIVLPGKAFDEAFLWRFFGYHAAPFAQDRVFAFSAEYIAEAKKVMNPKDLRKLNLPPELLFFNRITFGLNAIFQKLGATANFHQLYRRYTFPDERGLPAVALRMDDLPPKFLEATPQPVKRPPTRAKA